VVQGPAQGGRGRRGGEEKDREEEVPRAPRPMHACFHGGGGTSRVTKSVGIIAKSVRYAVLPHAATVFALSFTGALCDNSMLCALLVRR
jgi:hypothetical protein